MLELTVRLIASLAVVVGLMLLLARLVGKRYGTRAGAPVQVLHRQPLSRSASVAVITVGGRVLVVGTTDHQVSLLTELDPDELGEPGSEDELVVARSRPRCPTLLSTVLPVAQPAVVPDPDPADLPRPTSVVTRGGAHRADARPAPYVTGRRGAGGIGALAADLARRPSLPPRARRRDRARPGRARPRRCPGRDPGPPRCAPRPHRDPGAGAAPASPVAAASGAADDARRRPTGRRAPTGPDGPGGDSSVTIDLDGMTDKPSTPVTVILALSLLSLLPAILLTCTSFTKVLVVLGLTRNALGLQGIPPNQVLAGLALFLSLFIMAPVLSEMNDTGLQPYLDGDKTPRSPTTTASSRCATSCSTRPATTSSGC